jgi:PBSX family phage terminase large subunit
MTSPAVTPIAPFDVTAVRWHAAFMRDKTKVILLTGSKGGGKSRVAAEKVHAYCLKYPGSTGLVVRKVRETMTNSTILFMQTQVISSDPRIRYNGSAHRFEYKNDSIIAFGGMKDEEQAEAVRSIGQTGGLDIIWMEEANAFERKDFNELIGCLRAHAAPWQHLILTTNPDGPAHWIRQMFNLPVTPPESKFLDTPAGHVYYSSAYDNPFNPPDYTEKTLKMMTGVQYERLVLGKWTQAEGVVYDNFDPNLNVSEVEYNPSAYLLWGLDDGYVEGGGVGTITYHPRVALIAQENQWGGLNILAERYKTLESSYEDTFTAVQAMCEELGMPTIPDLCYVDSSAAMLRGALGAHGFFHTGASHPVLEGIRNLRRLISDGHGARLLQIHPRCTNLIREMQMYQYEEIGSLPGGERRPRKADDHGTDNLRYLAWHLRSEQA